jgi:hypothetical protein
MLDEAYLLHGLNALSRAHTLKYFADGHRGAAIIAATFFCREVEIDAGVDPIIRRMIDRHWTPTPLCAPFPPEPADPALIGRIIDHLEASMGVLRQAGHNVILAALGLKALRELPEAVTPSRVEGICRLVDAFTPTDRSTDSSDVDGPDFRDPAATGNYVLSELMATMAAFEGRGQGWAGHLVTYARALLDLREMGYRDTAAKGEHGFHLYLKRIRRGPLATDVPRPEHPQSDLLPHQVPYWERRGKGGVEIGHLFKYPYGFYGLMALATDDALQQTCVERAFHIF